MVKTALRPGLNYKFTQNIELSPQTQEAGEEEESHELLLGVIGSPRWLTVPGEHIQSLCNPTPKGCRSTVLCS